MVTKIQTKPPVGFNIRAHLYRLSDSHCEVRQNVTLSLFDLPVGTTHDDIDKYFEGQGDNIAVLSTEMLGSENATVVLSGLSEEGESTIYTVTVISSSLYVLYVCNKYLLFYVLTEVQKLQTKKHKLNKEFVTVKLTSCSPQADSFHDDASKSQDTSSTLVPPRTVVVTSVPETVDETQLQMYFEDRVSGGCDGAVESCSLLSHGKAQVTLVDSKGIVI